jgi:hypothetical protein
MAAKSPSIGTAKKSTGVVAPAPKAAVKKSAAGKTAVKKPAGAEAVAAKPVRKTAAKKPDAGVKVQAAPAKKAVAKKVEKPAVAAAVRKSSGKAVKNNTVSPELRGHMVATAAYFLAEKRGFAAGCEMQDWALAEAKIDAMLAGG